MLYCKIVKDDEIINGMTYDSFINQINSDLSVGCSLPFSVPKKELIRIIDESAKWFYTHYEYAVEDMYYVIPKQLFKSKKFQCDRGIILPKEIESVHGLSNMKTNFNNYPFNISPFEFDKTLLNSSNSNVDGLSVSNDYTEAAMYYITSQFFYDLMQNLTFTPISYNFNPNNKRLAINGRTSNFDMILSTSTQIKKEYLMNDEIFLRYCIAKAKMQLSRILGTFSFNLIGGITINTDMIRSEGQDELTKIEEEIKNQSSADFFFVQNSN